MDNERNNGTTIPTENEPFASKPVFSNDSTVYEGPKKQSGLGISSFIIGIIAVVLLIIAIVSGSSFTDQIASTNLPDPSVDRVAFQNAIEVLGQEVLASLVLAIFCIFGAGLISLVGLILAIIGVCSSKRRKMFSVIGIVLNVVVFVGGIGLFFAGIGAIATSAA
jgi:ABC-type sugar transport system permease subunit